MERDSFGETLTDDTTSRSGMYKILARLWLTEIDDKLWQELHTPSLSTSFTEAGGILFVENAAQSIEELAIDYCQLFIGPKNHLPPYQSVWQNGQLQGESTVSMREYIEVVGYETNLLPSGTMLDHLGVQLDVMSCILERIPLCHSEETEVVQGVAESFFARHLLWPGELFKNAMSCAHTEFYLSVIGMTRDFLLSER